MNQRRYKPTNVYSITRFFVVTYAISWVIWVPMALSSQGITFTQIPNFLGIIFGGISPSLTAIALTVIEEGKEGIQKMIVRLLRWRVTIYWYLFALFAPALILLFTSVLSAILKNTAIVIPMFGDWSTVIALFLFTLILGGPLGEEMGWRGYALPRLLVNRNALTASLFLGTLWGLWHLPLFWIQGSAQAGIPIAGFMLSILAESVLYNWIYMHTRGSLILAVLFHTAVNTWARLILLPLLANSLRPLWIAFGLEIFLAFIVVIFDRRKFLSKLNPVF